MLDNKSDNAQRGVLLSGNGGKSGGALPQFLRQARAPARLYPPAPLFFFFLLHYRHHLPSLYLPLLLSREETVYPWQLRRREEVGEGLDEGGGGGLLGVSIAAQSRNRSLKAARGPAIDERNCADG